MPRSYQGILGINELTYSLFRPQRFSFGKVCSGIWNSAINLAACLHNDLFFLSILSKIECVIEKPLSILIECPF